MSTATDVIIPIVTALCGGGLMKGLDWWGKQRDAAREASERAEARKAEADKSAATDLVAVMRENAVAAEQRGERAAERAVTIARALQDSAAAQTTLAHEVARIPDAMDALARRVESLERAVMDRERPSTPIDPPRLPPGGVS